MFIEESAPVNRPKMTVYAPGYEFLYKYFDKSFDREIISDVRTDGPASEDLYSVPAVMVLGDNTTADEAELSAFRERCSGAGLRLITLHVPAVVGTGMGDPVMRLARNIARGTMAKIKDNPASVSVIHAVDIPEIVKASAEKPDIDTLRIGGVIISFAELTDALAMRINNKKIPFISLQWAKILFSKSFFNLVTTYVIADNTEFESVLPGFRLTNPADYLRNHIYDDESL